MDRHGLRPRDDESNAAAIAMTEPDSRTGENQALKLLFEEITTRLKYLCDVGIGYLTLDR